MTEICTWPSCGHTAKGQCQPNKPTGLITDETLVKIENGKETPWWVAKLLHDRAAEIARLKAEVERLRGALEEIASGKYSGIVLTSFPPQDPAVNRARAALTAQEPRT